MGMPIHLEFVSDSDSDSDSTPVTPEILSDSESFSESDPSIPFEDVPYFQPIQPFQQIEPFSADLPDLEPAQLIPPPPEGSGLVSTILHCNGCNQHTVIGINPETVAAGYQIDSITCMNCNTVLDCLSCYIQTIEHPDNPDSCLSCGWLNVI